MANEKEIELELPKKLKVTKKLYPDKDNNTNKENKKRAL